MANTNALPPLAPAYGEIRPSFWEQHGTAVFIAGFVFVAFVGFIAWLIFSSPPAASVPLEVRPRKILTELAGPEDGNVLSKVSQTLRHYVSAAFQLPPGELTTVEFTAALAANDKIGADLAQAVAGFLRECDRRKFSPAASTGPLNAATRALQLVDLALQRRIFLDAQARAAYPAKT